MKTRTGGVWGRGAEPPAVPARPSGTLPERHSCTALWTLPSGFMEMALHACGSAPCMDERF